MILKRICHTLLVLIFVCLISEVNAQELKLQLNAGLMNYGGDLQNKLFTINQSHVTAGINLLYSVQNFTLRGGIAYGKVSAADKLNTELDQRNLNFNSTIAELSFCLEYDFISPEKGSKLMPYIFAGVGVYHYNPYTLYNSQKVYLQPLGTEGEGLSIYPDKKVYSLTNFEDPFGIGVRYKMSANILLGVEFNTRLLYSDYLDDVSTNYPKEDELFKAHGQLAVDLSYRGDEIYPTRSFPEGKRRGNPRQNDNYYTSVITLTYIFSQQSHFGNRFRHGKHSLDCPKIDR